MYWSEPKTQKDTEKDTEEDTEQPRSSRSKQTSTYPGPSYVLHVCTILLQY